MLPTRDECGPRHTSGQASVRAGLSVVRVRADISGVQDPSERWLRVLGLEPGASEQAVKEAYRDLVKVWHPDRFGTDERLRQRAQEKLAAVNAAYDKLRNYRPSARPSDPFTERPPRPQPGPASPPPDTFSADDSYGRPRHHAADPWRMAVALIVTAAVTCAGVWLYLSGDLRALNGPVSPAPTAHAPATPAPAPRSVPAHAAPHQGLDAAPSPAPESAAATGSVRVDSQPLGSRVFLDGALVGETPLVITDVMPGEHQIRIESSARGYEPWTSPVVIVAGHQEKLLAVMTRGR